MPTTRRARLTPLLAILGALILPGAAQAENTDAAAARMLDGLQRWLDDTRDLQAGFEQTLESGALGSGLSESGRLYLARPGRMRWEYLEPELKTALIENDTMSLYLAEDRQLIRTAIAEGEGDLLPRLLAGSGRLAELFEARLDRDADRRRPRLRLTPRDRGETFEQVSLTLAGPEHAIERAEVLDAAGNRMLYRFTELRRNEGLPDGTFEFTPPPVTEIVESP